MGKNGSWSKYWRSFFADGKPGNGCSAVGNWPELGVDIVNLGLIYDVQVDDQQLCVITMTLTTMGCPVSNVLSQQIIEQALATDGVAKCKINLVWEPVWSPSMMTRYAKIALGIHE